MLPLLLALLQCALVSQAAVCPGTDIYSNLTMVTLDSAPANWTTLNDWCAQYGLQLADVSMDEYTNISILTEACGVSESGLVAVKAVDGMAWWNCLVVSAPFGFRFPANPWEECAAASAVVCRAVPVISETALSTVTVKTKLTTTEWTPTIVITDSVTSSRLKTLPCGSTTITDTKESTVTVTDTETQTSITTEFTSTVYCPKRTQHICPTNDGNLRLIAATNQQSLPQQRQAECACRQVKMQLARLWSDKDIQRAGRVLFECIGGGSQAWIGNDQCLSVDDSGYGSVSNRCDPSDRLPVICDHHDDGCGVDCHSTTATATATAKMPLPKAALLQDNQMAVPTTCGDSAVKLIMFDYYTAISQVCSSVSMVPMDYRQDLYYDAVTSIASDCLMYQPGWVRSLNGSVAGPQGCQYLQYNLVSSVSNYLAISTQYCTDLGGVWCVSTDLPLVSTFATGTITDSSATTTTLTTRSTMTTTETFSSLLPTTTTLTSTVTTVRSLVLTPITTQVDYVTTVDVTDTDSVVTTIFSTIQNSHTITIYE